MLISGLKLFLLAEVAPLAGGDVAEHDVADSDAFEANYLKPNEFTHASNLSFFAFAQDEAELIVILPADFCGLKLLVVKAKPVVQKLESVARKFASDAH